MDKQPICLADGKTEICEQQSSDFIGVYCQTACRPQTGVLSISSLVQNYLFSFGESMENLKYLQQLSHLHVPMLLHCMQSQNVKA